MHVSYEINHTLILSCIILLPLIKLYYTEFAGHSESTMLSCVWLYDLASNQWLNKDIWMYPNTNSDNS